MKSALLLLFLSSQTILNRLTHSETVSKATHCQFVKNHCALIRFLISRFLLPSYWGRITLFTLYIEDLSYGQLAQFAVRITPVPSRKKFLNLGLLLCMLKQLALRCVHVNGKTISIVKIAVRYRYWYTLHSSAFGKSCTWLPQFKCCHVREAMWLHQRHRQHT